MHADSNYACYAQLACFRTVGLSSLGNQSLRIPEHITLREISCHYLLGVKAQAVSQICGAKEMHRPTDVVGGSEVDKVLCLRITR